MIRSRTLLLWLLMLVLPLQGMAASVMTLCGPAEAVAQGTLGLEAHHHGAAAAQAPAHDHPASVAAVIVADASDGPFGAASAASHLLQHCCGAACTMAFTVTSLLLRADHARPPMPQQAASLLHPGVVLDGPDRPPQA